MDTTDRLIELGRLNPEYANMIQEFMRLAELSTNLSCSGHLNMMVHGLLREAVEFKEEANPFMEPIGVKSETEITTVEVMGAPTSFWVTNSFSQRLSFLRFGRMAITYPNNATIVPLSVRLDVDKLVTIEEC